MTSDPRLPSHVVPHRYDLILEPDIPAATFRGSVTIDVELVEKTDEIVCNATDLEIDSALVVTGEGAAAVEHIPDIRLDAETERMHLTLPTDLPPGPARVTATFRGTINDQLRGFYRSTYADEHGVEHTIATTQFQSTDARRAFPCWDEPAWKATFATTLIVDPDHLAVANSAEVAATIDPDGRRRVTFAETMRMSTYLVAFVVGPLEVTEPIDAGGVPVRVVHRPGQGHLTPFALDVARHALEWFTAYYEIPYPGDKVDLLAIPDFAFGAMENLGCVTFREVLLLVDPEGASQPELQVVADVINHELAHMWFGDLVTIKWWEGIWLNEAFATFMETSCSNAYRPDWRVWTTFGRARAAAFDTDALASTRPIEFPVVTPEEAEGMFDILTYEKGASVVRMLEQHLGPEVFRDGVRHYLLTHAYANTETSDLWDALEHVSGEPVRRLMDGWIYQGGHPVIDAEQTTHGVELRQRHFTLDPEATETKQWAAPLGVRLHHDGAISEHRVLLDGPSTLLTAPGSLVSANADASGFYRVAHGPVARATIESGGPGPRTADERHGLIDDAWALTVADELTADDWLRLALTLDGETDLTVWQALSAGFGGLARLADDEPRKRLVGHIVNLAGPALHRLGLDTATDDDDRTRELRATLLRLLGVVAEDAATIAASHDRLDHADPTIAAAALIVVAHADADAGPRIRGIWKTADDPQTEQRHLRALADLPLARLPVLDDILTGEVRSQDGPYVIRRALANLHAGPAVWAFVRDNWAALNERFPSNSVARMLEGITTLDTAALVGDTGAFLAANPVPQGAKQIAQHLERQRINAAFRVRETSRFEASGTR
ncbi:MAG: M1 family metallopeptidase [Acidimicrobiales bacterium]|nr:M1 family metallopeptidase [Acidimicrobiales bacterium]